MIQLSTEQENKLTALIWGGTVPESIFKRWAQGFEWSCDEKCALLQWFGGPCAVIAPVQGYFLQKILYLDLNQEDSLPEVKTNVDIENISDVERDKVFVSTLQHILKMLSPSSWTVCLSNNIEQSSSNSPSSQENLDFSSDNKLDLTLHDFHANLRLHTCDSPTDLHRTLSNNLTSFKEPFGVLRFLYSAVLSKGIDNVINEMDNPDIPLIDGVHGHGSQSLVNLLICGQAVSNVFDNSREIGGLALRGIPHSCNIGFLTLLERLRYCTVGNFLKQPRYPIWLVGSETHLSLFFSRESSLVAPDSALDRANKIFDKYDPEDNGFIATDALEGLLKELDLVSEPEYVQIMCENLDPEGLGIIVRSKFFDEFYSNENKRTLPESFDIFHYNGLSQSSSDKKVRFRRGTVRYIDWQECSGKAADSDLESCLQLRWPGIWITWHDDQAPSLN